MVTQEAEGPVTGEVGIKDLLHAGVHFGHQTKRWNPKMKRFIFDKRNGIHIIDLAKTLAMLRKATDFAYETVLNGQSILFVGTKKQAQEIIKVTADKLGMHYVTNRWLGGTLSNSVTIRQSVKRMKELAAIESSEAINELPKKEAAVLRRELTKLRRNLSGIANMSEMPGAVFVVDINREAIAVNESKKLGIPVIAMVDTCCDPDPIDYIIPSNDDAMRAIKIVTEALSQNIEKAQAEYSKIAAERARQAEEERKQAAAMKAAAQPAPEAGAEGEKPAARRKPAAKKSAAKKDAAAEPAAAVTVEPAVAEEAVKAEEAPKPEAATAEAAE